MYKAIFIDLDRTLTNSEEMVGLKSAKNIKNLVEEGIYVIICSGRNRKYTIEKSKESNASSYIISSNGGEIYNYENGEVIYENIIKKDSVRKIYDYCQNNNIICKMNAGDIRLLNKKREYKEGDKIIDQNIDIILDKYRINQCAIERTELQKARLLKEYINGFEDVAVVNESNNISKEIDLEKNAWLDISNKDTSKGNSIKILCSQLNIDLKDTIGIGDSDNDISMFDVVGYSVAVENASNEIKKIVNEVTLSNDNDGVGDFLEKILRKI